MFLSSPRRRLCASCDVCAVGCAGAGGRSGSRADDWRCTGGGSSHGAGPAVPGEAPLPSWALFSLQFCGE